MRNSGNPRQYPETTGNPKAKHILSWGKSRGIQLLLPPTKLPSLAWKACPMRSGDTTVEAGNVIGGDGRFFVQVVMCLITASRFTESTWEYGIPCIGKAGRIRIRSRTNPLGAVRD